MEFVDARLPEANFFEFDLCKIKGLLGYVPQHDVEECGGDGGGDVSGR